MPDRDLLAPAYPDDDGTADPRLAAALTAYAADPAGYPVAVALLQASRLLVPVVAVAGEVELDERGLARDKTSDMAAVLVRTTDGRRGLLAFTSLATLAAWDPAARPVPVPAPTAALAAVQDGADALVVDAAGPVTVVVDGQHLRPFAAGWRLVRVGEDVGWVDPSSIGAPGE